MQRTHIYVCIAELSSTYHFPTQTLQTHDQLTAATGSPVFRFQELLMRDCSRYVRLVDGVECEDSDMAKFIFLQP